ncbi:hypothetical protein MHAS44199_17930 [Mycolicibacterium hassiacum DSM 44199]|nr:hypothetical protein [Mycolicibacterium hassiacum DSM 44199]
MARLRPGPPCAADDGADLARIIRDRLDDLGSVVAPG